MKKIILTLLILILITSVQANCQNVDLESVLPVPLIEDVFMYDIYIINWNNGAPVGNVVFPDITADIEGVRTCTCDYISNPACCAAPPTISGTISMDSIVYDGEITINNFEITLDGAFGFLIDWIIDFFEQDFIPDLEDAFGDCDYMCQVQDDVCNEECR